MVKAKFWSFYKKKLHMMDLKLDTRTKLKNTWFTFFDIIKQIRNAIIHIR